MFRFRNSATPGSSRIGVQAAICAITVLLVSLPSDAGIGDKDLPYGWHRKLAEAGATFVIIAAGLEQIDDEAEREEQAARDQEAQP